MVQKCMMHDPAKAFSLLIILLIVSETWRSPRADKECNHNLYNISCNAIFLSRVKGLIDQAQFRDALPKRRISMKDFAQGESHRPRRPIQGPSKPTFMTRFVIFFISGLRLREISLFSCIRTEYFFIANRWMNSPSGMEVDLETRSAAKRFRHQNT